MKKYKIMLNQENDQIRYVEPTIETYETYNDGFLFIYDSNDKSVEFNPIGIINLNNCLSVAIQKR